METTVKVPLFDLSHNVLNYFTREDLRNLTRRWFDINVGRNKDDTIYNLLDSEHYVKINIQIIPYNDIPLL